MKTLKIAILSTAIAFAPAAFAQVAEQPAQPPVETEQPTPEMQQDTDATSMPAPETTTDTDTPEYEEAKPEVSNSDDSYSEPMAL